MQAKFCKFTHVLHYSKSLFARKTGIVLGQLRVKEKRNEISAVPELLDLINVQGCTITSDAMSCQKKTVQKIVDNKCDYDNALKDFQMSAEFDPKGFRQLYYEGIV